MVGRARTPNWKAWLRSWDEQQESFNPERERRFTAMLDVLEASVGRRFTVLDLGSGPGSLSARVLTRFPRARSVAVDYDPVAMRVGRGALGSYGGRLTWVDARLGAPGWTGALPRGKFDAAISTTALHWLRAPALGRLYVDLARVIRRGGIVLNGDHLPWADEHRALARLAERVRRVRYPRRSLDAEWSAWRRWWKEAEREPALREAFAEHRRRSAGHPKGGDLPLSAHVRAFRRAGFGDVEVLWQDLENRVLYARRP
jgi:SAM-dependent methyltransferase